MMPFFYLQGGLKMNSQKTLICISAILLILSIFLTIFNRIYAFNKAGT